MFENSHLAWPGTKPLTERNTLKGPAAVKLDKALLITAKEIFADKPVRLKIDSQLPKLTDRLKTRIEYEQLPILNSWATI